MLSVNLEKLPNWFQGKADAFMRLDLYNLLQRGVEPLEKN